MKRGFLKTKPTSDNKALTSGTPSIQIPTTKIKPRKAIPAVGAFPRESFNFRIITLPKTSLFLPNEPISLCLLYPGAKESILALPDFPAPYIHYSSPIPYSISSVPGAGFGMFAAFDLNPGELVLRERPMIVVPIGIPYAPGMSIHPDQILETLLEKLCSSSREAFYKLHNCKGPASGRSRASGILDTNALATDALPGEYNGLYGAVCRHLSRINHSCTPNAEHHWDLNSFTYEVRALRAIQKGEQIFITYLNTLNPRANRQNELSSKYSFVCACPPCSLPTNESRRSDLCRSVLATASRKPDPSDEFALNAWIADLSLPDDHVIKHSKKMVGLMEEEGLYVENIWLIHYPRLCKAYCALQNLEAAREWANKTAIMNTAFWGNDGGWNKVAAAPEKTNWWGLRDKTLNQNKVQFISS